MDVSIIITIAGIVVSVIVSILVTLFFTSRKKLAYEYNTIFFNIEKYGLDDLKIKYKDNDIGTLSMTKLIIKNIGNRTIEKNDIAHKDKLCLSVTEHSHFFDWKVISNNKANGITVAQIEPSKCNIDFDFLDKKDVIEIYFYHNSDNDPIFTGRIKECRIIKNDIIKKKKTMKYLAFCGLLLTLIYMIILGLTHTDTLISSNSDLPLGYVITGFVMLILDLFFTFRYGKYISISIKKNEL